MKFRLARAAALIPLALVLTGCVNLSMGLTINSDSDISVSATVGIDSSVAPMAGITDMCDYLQQNGGFSLPGNINMQSSTNNGYLNCTISSTLTLADFSSATSTGLSLTHTGGLYTFTFDSAADTSSISPGELSSIITSMSISVTFPGAVVSHSGSSTVQGNTVTWTDPNDLLASTLTATGKDKASVLGSLGSNGTPWGLIAGIVGAVVVIAVVIVAIVAVSRGNAKKRAAAAWQAQQYAQWQQWQATQYPPQQPAAPQPQPSPDQFFSRPPEPPVPQNGRS